jgi:hypothetical protein
MHQVSAAKTAFRSVLDITATAPAELYGVKAVKEWDGLRAGTAKIFEKSLVAKVPVPFFIRPASEHGQHLENRASSGK